MSRTEITNTEAKSAAIIDYSVESVSNMLFYQGGIDVPNDIVKGVGSGGMVLSESTNSLYNKLVILQ